MDEAKTGGKQSLLRYQLLRQQNGICVYTGEPLELTQLESYEIDHIVPRSLGGPDAMLNYALTTRAHNADKGNRTPFDWLRGKGHWQAYLERVSKNSNFNRKKKDLLTSDKAVELAERYMSLAETAWIAKLAQTILAIHFQWPIGGIGGDRRIIVANGGLTAKIRNRYALGRLLQSPKDLAEKTDPSKLSQSEFVKYCEAIDKKNRNNKKHHALDAAILSFVPQWTRDRDKRDFFRFPKGVQENPQTYFKDILDKVVPEEIFHAKAKLEETFYAKRTIDGIAQMVLRRELRKLGYKTVQMKEVFSVESIAKNAKDILDRRTRELILDVAAREPSQEQWDQWCETARLPGGPRIRRVTLSIGEPTEYKDLSKDGSGIYAKGKNHRCQIVWRNKKGTYKVAPVYAHGPKKSLIESLKQLSEFQEIFGVFQSGQLVEIQSDIVANANTSLNKGIYTINSIWTDGRAKLTDIMGVQTPPVSLSKLISAGFRIYKG